MDLREIHAQLHFYGEHELVSRSTEIYRRHSTACVCDSCLIAIATNRYEEGYGRFSHDDINNLLDVFNLPRVQFPEPDHYIRIWVEKPLTGDMKIWFRGRIAQWMKALKFGVYISD